MHRISLSHSLQKLTVMDESDSSLNNNNNDDEVVDAIRDELNVSVENWTERDTE